MHGLPIESGGGGPASGPSPGGFGATNLPYDSIGGDDGVRALVDAFYDRIRESSPLLREMHPPDDRESREKLYEFLSGWLGGPQLYMEKRGHPRLRMRHMPFAIDQAAVDEWMRCMTQAIDERGIVDPLREFLLQRLGHTAAFMRNRP